MNDLTLESLAKRVKTLENAIGPKMAEPSRGDWDAVLAASQQLSDYDYEAQADQDACDIRIQTARPAPQ